MNILLVCLQAVLIAVHTSAQMAPFQLVNSGPVKRTYVIHRGANGEPRYTTLVRRNFLRFGKRSGAPPGPEGMADAERNKFDSDYDPTFEDLKKEKRARDFIRFGKRGTEDMEDTFTNDQSQSMQFPYKRFGRRRMSNFLRFG